MRPRNYRRKVPYPPPGHRDLQSVFTIKEAASLWFKHPSTLRYHIDKGNLAARKSGKLWLISKDSLIAYYGHSPLIRTQKSKNPS